LLLKLMPKSFVCCGLQIVVKTQLLISFLKSIFLSWGIQIVVKTELLIVCVLGCSNCC